MLDVLRASKGGIITWIFLAAIIVVFVISFGPGSLAKGNHGCGGAPIYAAKVNGKTVPAVVYQRQIDQVSSYYRAQYGDDFVRMMAPQLAEQAMSSVVSRALLVQEAERRGLEVNKDEINRVVWASPEFQDNGRFSRTVYNDVAQQQFGSTRQYEELLREELLVQHLEAAFEASVNVPASDVHDAWKRISDRVALSYVLFPTVDARTEVKVDGADVQAFAARESARIEKFYKENPARFDQPRKVRVRHILARGAGKDDAAAKKKIETAIERVKKGEDFAKVAADLSDDENTKAAGGDLGLITAGAVDDDFAKAALALEPGQISGPVKTPSGWHVIKADEVIPAKKESLDAARPEIARELLVGDRAAEFQKQKAEAALQAARAGKSLADLFPEPQKAEPAKDGKPAVPEKVASLTLGGKPVVARETGPFPASASFVPQLNAGGDLLKDAVAAESGAVLPRAYDTPQGVVVAVVKQRQRPDESAFAKEREMVEMQLRIGKAQQLRQSWLTDLRARATVVENVALVQRAAGEDPRRQQEQN
jgi:peptidyl-prolyl cis-trans isomerase D